MGRLAHKMPFRITAAAGVLSLAVPISAAAQGFQAGAGLTLRERLGALVERGREHYRDMQQEAMERLAAAQRPGSCADRQARFVAVAPEAVFLARLSESVYSGEGDQMAAQGLVEGVLGPGRIGFQDQGGNFYAETRSQPDSRTLFIAFRGTRAGARGDIATDLGNFAGKETPYYSWARALTSRLVASHLGWRVVTTGHSLGGGLALAAALANPTVQAIVFDPAGLSDRTWFAASEATRRRMLDSSSAFIAVTATAMDPISAGSITGLSVIPARIYAIPVADGGSPVERHRIASLRVGLSQAAANPATSCRYDAGFLGVAK